MPCRDAEGLGDLGQRQTQVVMQDEDGSLLHWQSPEDALELVAVHDRQQAIRPGRPVDRQDSNVGRPCPATPGLGVAGMDDHLANPGFEAVRVAQGGKLAPDRDQRPLQGILGQIAVAQDPHGQRVRPVTDRLDQCPERIAITALCPLDEIPHRHSLNDRVDWRPGHTV